MRKHILTFCLFQLSVFYFQLSAQPTLTAANTNPQIGESYHGQLIQIEDQGDAGPNVTWDFSVLTVTGGATYDYVSPSSVPGGSNFPDADIAYGAQGSQGGQGYDFYAISSSVYERVGAMLQVAIPYSDGAEYLRFPFTYGDSYTDDFDATFTNQGTVFHRYGTVTVEADGWGTLILPEGTVQDVLRIKTVENYQDDYTSQGFPGTIYYNSEIYTYYKPGYHIPLLALTHLDSDILFTEYGFYLNPNTVGIKETMNKDLAMSVLPNPATSQTTISFDLKESEKVQITVLNSIGQQVAVVANDKLQSGHNNFSLDVQSFPSGIYFVEVKSGSGALRQKLFVRH